MAIKLKESPKDYLNAFIQRHSKRDEYKKFTVCANIFTIKKKNERKKELAESLCEVKWKLMSIQKWIKWQEDVMLFNSDWFYITFNAWLSLENLFIIIIPAHHIHSVKFDLCEKHMAMDIILKLIARLP